ncbi:hypothetical protein [Pseudomonas syringae]|uniref:hypothetical protein n=1 Tax=Pseudomonas syringae TaxID=317 RepID=UPI00200B4354|nr:hypothetical protein [Pseudomonas syringae]MCK9709853.1 hypothetical protein [Pseudomonas syringae pv. syringae]
MSSSIARIHVNGIEVGSLPVEIYNGIVRATRQERRLYFAYAYRAVGVILRMLARSTVAVPGLLLLAFSFFLLVEPASITELVTSLRAATPEEITAALRATLVFAWFLTVSLVPAALALFCPGKIDFHNPFTDSVNRRVRSMLEVPTEGRLCVFIENPSTVE